jgi:hypothetical protein
MVAVVLFPNGGSTIFRPCLWRGIIKGKEKGKGEKEEEKKKEGKQKRKKKRREGKEGELNKPNTFNP